MTRATLPSRVLNGVLLIMISNVARITGGSDLETAALVGGDRASRTSWANLRTVVSQIQQSGRPQSPGPASGHARREP